MSTGTDGVTPSGAPALPPRAGGATHSVANAIPPASPGPPSSTPSVNNLGQKEGITSEEVGNWIARVLAGASGGVLYGASFLVGGGLTLAVFLPVLVICAPPALVGAGIGALVSKIIEESPKEGAEMGGVIGAALPGAVVGSAGALVEAALSLPKALIYNTTGRLGAGLCAFAATGKTEEEQLAGKKFQPEQSYLLEITRKKSTNEKLLDALFVFSLPLFIQIDPDLFKGTKSL